jgi:ATP-dependent RNA helicase DDX35
LDDKQPILAFVNKNKNLNCRVLGIGSGFFAKQNLMCAFWKPGTVQPGSSKLAPSASRLLGVSVPNISADANEENAPLIGALDPSTSRLPIMQQRLRLPIRAMRRELLYLVESNSTVVVVGETGSGKTTQLPQYLYEAGWTTGGRLVICTQPRRVAAMTVAMRVAEEMGVMLGAEVGYAVRFDDKWDHNLTQIKYTTDGLLLRELLLDPLLTRCSVIIVDEAHERSVQSDILLALLKKVQRKRKDLKVIVASATVDAVTFQNYFHSSEFPCAVVSVQGRQFGVDILYLEKSTPDYVQTILETVLDIHFSEESGDVLVFLTGQEEIDAIQALLEDRLYRDPSQQRHGAGLTIRVLPLHSSLPVEQQMAVFTPTAFGERKVILSTNIAETSVTIDNIAYVIDCGFVKVKSFDPYSGTESLFPIPISQASANQRAGRAGRVRPGKCFRIFPEPSFSRLPIHSVPEIQRTSLASVVLLLKALGVDDVVHFDFISPPSVESLVQAMELLHALKVIDNDGRLTDPLGNQIAEFPLEPLLAKMCMSSGAMECSEEAITIAAMLSVPPVFIGVRELVNKVDKARNAFAVAEGDHMTLLNVYNVYINTPTHERDALCRKYYLNPQVMARSVTVRKQILRYMKRFQVPMMSCQEKDQGTESVVKCVATGFFPNAAQLQNDGSYKTLRGGRSFHLHPSSVLLNSPPPWIVFHEVIHTTRPYARFVSKISASWLLDIAPDFFHLKQPPIV